MKITKYNKAKEEGSTGRITDSGTLISSPSYASAEVCDEAKRLKDTHLIFGQPFNGTADVSGDLTNVNNITASGGDITVRAEDGKGGNITADGIVTAQKFIGDVEAENVTTVNLSADSGRITSLRGDNLGYNYAEIKEALIDMLTSVEITTEKLTVTKQAHFFELIIDKIKAAGGAVLLTPADGFKVDKVRLINHNPAFYRLYFRAKNGDKAISNMW